jgi:chemotaxis protein CheX
MSAAVAEPSAPLAHAIAEPELTNAVIGSVNKALAMCDSRARCVGVSSVPAGDAGVVTGIIGVHGNVSGFITVNMAERFAVRAVARLVQEDYERLTSQVVDGVGELTNIIVGGIKRQLAGTPWSYSHATIPSVIVGRGYHIAYARGLAFVSTTFECDDPEAVLLEDRLMRVSLSLMQL